MVTYDRPGANFCPSVIAHLMKSTIAFAFASSIFGLVLNSLYTSRYEKLAMGYVSAPGALISETDSHDLSPAGRDFPTASNCCLLLILMSVR